MSGNKLGGRTQPLPTIRDLQGNTITVHDLPRPDTRRWVINRKAIVVRAVRCGLITLEEVLERYQMELSEFQRWERGLREHEGGGLRVTYAQKYKFHRK